MGLNSDGFSCLSAWHGCKCMQPDESVSIESLLVTIGREIAPNLKRLRCLFNGVSGRDYTIFISTETMNVLFVENMGILKQAVLWLKRLKAQGMESTVGRLTKPLYHTVEQLDDFLNATKNQRKPKMEMFFPDLRLFIDSSVIAMKEATLEELDPPKRYC
ncbi:putative alpha-L-glutamate ligase [Labeo rohita]|uniref:Alpha-L-glutamate ligase n=1 Tax=Labeo rohita TaxID=84645 RepID=A0ABQ8L9X8_LABRO|nr:putative alpha-L-glutamate ligase [Labeo rohita]